MKKLVLIIFSFLITSCLYSQIINFPDANFKAKLLASESGVPIAYNSGVSFKIDANNDNEIQLSEALEVETLHVDYSNIEDLTGIEYFTNLTRFNFTNNLITTVDLTPLTSLGGFGASNNLLTSLDLTGLTNLIYFSCNDNLLTSLDISGITNLRTLHCDNNQLSTLNLNTQPSLNSVKCKNNLFDSLDVSDLSNLQILDCSSNNNLVSLYIKNGSTERQELDFSNNNNLQYICADAEQLADVEEKINLYGYTNCYTNSICSYTEGDDFYLVSGITKYDENVDGCDAMDIDYPNLVVSFSNGIITGETIADFSGDYHYNVQGDTYTFTPILENTTYFNISPTNMTVTFPDDASPFIQDFCISPNGNFPDLEISILEVEVGFDFSPTYKIVFKNKGTMTQSGSIDFLFDDEIVDLDSSVPLVSSQSTNLLEWDFLDLLPFETREIDLNLNLNMPPLNFGDILSFTAEISSSLTDITPVDNTFVLDREFICCLSTPSFVFSDYFSQYPNPTNDYLNIKMKEYIDLNSIMVFNLLGQEVKRISPTKRHIKIDVSNFETGHYFIKIVTPEKVFNSRFIKK